MRPIYEIRCGRARLESAAQRLRPGKFLLAPAEGGDVFPIADEADLFCCTFGPIAERHGLILVRRSGVCWSAAAAGRPAAARERSDRAHAAIDAQLDAGDEAALVRC